MDLTHVCMVKAVTIEVFANDITIDTTKESGAFNAVSLNLEENKSKTPRSEERENMHNHTRMRRSYIPQRTKPSHAWF